MPYPEDRSPVGGVFFSPRMTKSPLRTQRASQGPEPRSRRRPHKAGGKRWKGQLQRYIRRYRASHIFEDIIADNILLTFQFNIVGQDFDRAGEAAHP